jgi:tRNA(Ile)-lysidine synthase
LILPGRPVRGGGRAGTDGRAIDLTCFAALAAAVQRRLLRHAARQLGAAPDFAETERLRELALTGRAGQKVDLAGGLRAERSHREVRLTVAADGVAAPTPEYRFAIPGEVDAEAFGLKLSVEAASGSELCEPREAILRNWRSGDRIWPRHTSAPRKVSEVLDRLKITGESRRLWPVLEIGSKICWMRGVELQSDPLEPEVLQIFATDLDTGEQCG